MPWIRFEQADIYFESKCLLEPYVQVWDITYLQAETVNIHTVVQRIIQFEQPWSIPQNDAKSPRCLLPVGRDDTEHPPDPTHNQSPCHRPPLHLPRTRRLGQQIRSGNYLSLSRSERIDN